MSLTGKTFTDAQGSSFTDAAFLTFNRRSRVSNDEIETVSTDDYTTETTNNSAVDVISFCVWYWPTSGDFSNRAAGADPYELLHPTTKAKVITFQPDDVTYGGIPTLEGKCDHYLENVLIPEINAITAP